MKKIYKIWLYLLVLIGFVLIFTDSCKKDDYNSTVPTLITTTLSNITSTTAVCGGKITSDGGSIVTERGVCWRASQNPTIADSKSTDGSTGTGSFTASISGLTSNITYYVRAYATNSAGTGYGDEKIFTTSATSDFVITLSATEIKKHIH